MTVFGRNSSPQNLENCEAEVSYENWEKDMTGKLREEDEKIKAKFNLSKGIWFGHKYPFLP